MRFAFAGCDRNLAVLDQFLAAGWEPVKIFSAPQIDALSSIQALSTLAAARHLPLELNRLNRHDLAWLAEQQCDALVIGSYNYLIPEWHRHLRYAINFHPSPLPHGRGPYPLVNAILQRHHEWAVSCHRIDHSFDTGAILDHEYFPLTDCDTHESLSLKIQMASGRLARRIAADLPAYWEAASIQEEGDYWPLFSLRERTIDFARSAEQIQLQLRAFGRLACFARFGDQVIRIDAGYAWRESHQEQPGTPVCQSGTTMVVACRDGYVAINEWCVLNPNSPTGS